jgi:CheY-like chemotaxis protein
MVSALIVDPSSFQRSLLAGLARGAGLQRLFLASTSLEAETLLIDHNPTLVITDFSIGPDDACAFARRVRRSEDVPNRGVPIIVLMARATRADVQASREAGIDAVLMKPCSQAMLQDKVASVTAEGRPFVTSAAYVGPCRRRRADQDYRGPMRRMSDPTGPETADGDGPYRPSPELLNAVARLSASAMMIESSQTGAQQVLARALQVRAVALEVGDGEAAEGAHELLRYLEAVGATARLSAQAVQVHIEALNQIIALPPGDRAMRLRLSEGLRRLVTKKLALALAG